MERLVTKPARVAVASVGVTDLAFNLSQRSLVGQRGVQSTLIRKYLEEELGRRSFGKSLGVFRSLVRGQLALSN